jgi:hypothetical protein
VPDISVLAMLSKTFQKMFDLWYCLAQLCMSDGSVGMNMATSCISVRVTKL